MLPEDKWGTVIQNYTQLYGTNGDYNNQLKALEAARTKDPKNPALRFLLGFHYGYLGYPKEAVRELSKAVELEGRDPAARKLHDIFAAKIGASPVGPPEMPSGPKSRAVQAGRNSTGVGATARRRRRASLRPTAQDCRVITLPIEPFVAADRE